MKDKCPGSGQVQMLTWLPTKEDGYPGAAICLECSGGILVVKGTVHTAVSQSGVNGLAGRLRVHQPAKG